MILVATSSLFSKRGLPCSEQLARGLENFIVLRWRVGNSVVILVSATASHSIETSGNHKKILWFCSILVQNQVVGEAPCSPPVGFCGE